MVDHYVFVVVASLSSVSISSSSFVLLTSPSLVPSSDPSSSYVSVIGTFTLMTSMANTMENLCRPCTTARITECHANKPLICDASRKLKNMPSHMAVEKACFHDDIGRTCLWDRTKKNKNAALFDHFDVEVLVKTS